jgi:hypothetical protein
MPIFAGGAIASCGALLVVAGAAKAYAGARRVNGGDAIRRALRVPRPAWRLVELAAAVAEVITGGLVCAGAYRVASGVLMAALGVTFCALLGYARRRRVTGGCGCLGGGRGGRQAITWREFARAGILGCAGVVLAAAPPLREGGLARLSAPSFYAGFLAGAGVLVALTATSRVRLRGPRCHRPLWRPAQAGARDLSSSGVFQAMAQSAGPFETMASHQRTGCTDEYWFTPVGGTQRVVKFTVSHRPGGAAPAIRAVLTESLIPREASPLRPLPGTAHIASNLPPLSRHP